jgi:hypothetical protein
MALSTIYTCYLLPMYSSQFKFFTLRYTPSIDPCSLSLYHNILSVIKDGNFFQLPKAHWRSNDQVGLPVAQWPNLVWHVACDCSNHRPRCRSHDICAAVEALMAVVAHH